MTGLSIMPARSDGASTHHPCSSASKFRSPHYGGTLRGTTRLWPHFEVRPALIVVQSHDFNGTYSTVKIGLTVPSVVNWPKRNRARVWCPRNARGAGGPRLR